MCYFQLIQCVKYYLISTAIISFIIVYFIRKHILTANMSLYNADECDEEVYCGKISLKEVKKRLLWDKQQQPIHSTSEINSPNNSGDHNESFKILQAHSQPNLIPKPEGFVFSDVNTSTGFDMKAADDSFIQMENMVANLCVSPKNNEKTGELNNTLEVIEYILNNPPSNTKIKKEKNDDLTLMTEIKNKIEKNDDLTLMTEIKNKIEKNDDLTLMTEIKNEPNVSHISLQNIDREVIKNEAYNSPEPPQNTPVKSAHQLYKCAEGHATPRDIKEKPIFKTPAQPLSLKKPASLKKTPNRSNAYQHISSPVASYIKNCPIAPLVKDVHPKKPLPGTSSIPKLVKNIPPAKPSNKENVNLPSVAYKSAKKTRVIDVPDKQKLPQSHWVKKMPKPLVMKHDHREQNFVKKEVSPQQEDSFANLSYHQAEVSVCTQKSAFKPQKHF